MYRYLLNISLMASLLLAFTACRDEGEHEIIPDIPTAEKTPIALSVGGLGDEGATRAITEELDESKLGTLPAGTAIYMVMKSEKKHGSSSDTKYAVTKGITGEAVASTKKSLSTSPLMAAHAIGMTAMRVMPCSLSMLLVALEVQRPSR